MMSACRPGRSRFNAPSVYPAGGPVVLGRYRNGAAGFCAGAQPSPAGGGRSTKLPTRTGDSTSVPASGPMTVSAVGVLSQSGNSGATSRSPQPVGSPSMYRMLLGTGGEAGVVMPLP